MDNEGHFINHEMVVLARESRGLTQSQAAKLFGVSQAKLSKIETGLVPFSNDLISNIAKSLRYPVSFFSLKHTILGPGTSEFFHRKRQATSTRLLRQIHAAINVRIINISRLLRAVDIGPDNIPRIEIMENWSPTDIARAVRAQWNVPSGPIENVMALIENAGGIIVQCNFGTPLIDAINRYIPGLPRLFFVDANLSGDRQRMTLAHELGHAIMHQTPHPEMEKEAFEFSGEFLMPSGDIGAQFHQVNIARLAALKPVWKVAMSALLVRAEHLGKISPRMSRHVWAQMSKAGYRTREPIDIPREDPHLLDDIIRVHQNELGYGLDELGKLLELYPEEAQEVYGINSTGVDRRVKLRLVRD